ncbi:hypothetical protein EDC26_103302 [Paralcaligenes ureilyticus]|uniref:Uncharacterized protein n=2 Tax=Paralcaligenes ureilyticus TaxID=627131 RepID=A0A4R3MAH5_9BURK|nr:hypothetical protein EDC26_103302 [Paralcaligenes ureilyticus]
MVAEGESLAARANVRLRKEGVAGKSRVADKFLSGKTTECQIQDMADAFQTDLVVLEPMPGRSPGEGKRSAQAGNEEKARGIRDQIRMAATRHEARGNACEPDGDSRNAVKPICPRSTEAGRLQTATSFCCFGHRAWCPQLSPSQFNENMRQ